MKEAPGRKKRTLWQRMAQKVGLMPVPLGDRGEAFAVKFLRKQGMRVIARNRVSGKGEIDVVAIDGKFLVFVEVKTRAAEGMWRPESSVRYWKKKAVRDTVRRLLRKHGRGGLVPRIDVVAIVWPAGERRPREVRWHKGMIAFAGW
jgi:putative endonuclease